MGDAQTHQARAFDRLGKRLGEPWYLLLARHPYAALMTNGVARLVARGQLCLWIFLVVCIALHPGLVLKRDEGGLSNFGIHLKTVIPYSLALILGATYSYRATRLMRADDHASVVMRWMLLVYALLLALSLISTYVYKLGNLLNDLHVGINIATALFETTAAVWIAFTWRADTAMLVIFGFEVSGFVLGALTLTNVVHLVFVAEVLVGVGFGFLLYRSLKLQADPLETP